MYEEWLVAASAKIPNQDMKGRIVLTVNLHPPELVRLYVTYFSPAASSL